MVWEGVWVFDRVVEAALAPCLLEGLSVAVQTAGGEGGGWNRG